MPALFFDTVTLHADRIELPDGLTRTFKQLGLSDSESLRLCARDLTLRGAPSRNLVLAAERLDVRNAGSTLSSGPRTVRIFAAEVVGPLDVACRGVVGATGAAGRPGAKAPTKRVTITDGEPPFQKPKTVSVINGPGGPGGPGGVGGPGGAGGEALVWYRTATVTPRASAPGGAGGPGGRGGAGGAGGGGNFGPVFPAGATGPQGARGPAGPNGVAQVRRFGEAAELWLRWAEEHGGPSVSAAWAAHRLDVAEHHYRTGTLAGVRAADSHLLALDSRIDARVHASAVTSRVGVLLQQLYEHSTFLGVPRDLDISPDVDFVGQDNAALLQAALSLLEMGTTIAETDRVQTTMATTVRLAADEARNAGEAAAIRRQQADQAHKVARSNTDLARGRVKNLQTKSVELQTAIKAEQAQNAGPLGQLKQIIDVGVAVGSAVAGVATGVGAVVAIGQGFVALQDVANGASSLFDLVGDVKKHLDDKSMATFKRSFGDLKDATKSIIDVGAMVAELDAMAANGATDPKVRELAAVQRERLLLEQEVGVNVQMEKESQLGIRAAAADVTAIEKNVAAAEALASQIGQINIAADAAITGLLAAVQPLLDLLSVRHFMTVRAKEIYLALDPVQPVAMDIGRIHPDRWRALTPKDRMREVALLVAPRLKEIVEWASLVDDLLAAGDLDRSPVPFSFSTDDPAILAPLRTGGHTAFAVAIEDLLEEDGSQLYEVKLESLTVVLHGARLVSDDRSIKITQHGRWSARRRPGPGSPTGQIKHFALRPHEGHLAVTAVAGGVEATLSRPVNLNQPPIALWGRGIAGAWELEDDGGIDLTDVTRIEVRFDTMALSQSTVRLGARQARRGLRPVPGWPAAAVGVRPVTEVPRRPLAVYGYRSSGGVAAVGAGLL